MKALSTLRLTIIILAAALLTAMVPALQLTYAAGPWYVAPGGNDSGSCQSPASPCATINGALSKSEPGDTIYVGSGTYTGLGDQVVAVYKDVILSGGWNAGFTLQSGTSIIVGEFVRRGITVITGTTLTIEHFTVLNGRDTQSQFIGGGIWNEGYLTLNASTVRDSRGGVYNKGILTVTNSIISTNLIDGLDNDGALFLYNSTVSGNGRNGIFSVANSLSILHDSAVTGNTGGGIRNNGGALSLINSTVSGNQTGGPGGGIYNYSGTLTLHSSTISSNTADYGGGIAAGSAGSVELENSIVAGNSAGSSGPDCSGTLSSVNYSFIGDTFDCTIAAGTGNVLDGGARLLPLTGSPGYHPLLPDSPAIDAGNPAGCSDNNGNPLILDQRGAPRVGRCDIGVFEFGSIPVSLNKRIFLPLVTRNACTVGICGYVTENGVPAGGVLVELRFDQGSNNWSTRASVVTSSNGRYSFTNAPSLTPGQSYYVRYLNTTVPSRLSIWQTRSLQTYTTGDVADMGSFDIANIDLTAPDPDATVSLPRLFQWTPRDATPLDNYEFNLFDPDDGDPYFYTEPPLGYTGGYTLRSLPGGFSTGIPYGWYIGVYDLSGGYGESFYYYTVTISSAGPSLHVESRSKPLEKMMVNDINPCCAHRASIPGERLATDDRRE